MNKKKVLSIMLIAALSASMLSACGGSAQQPAETAAPAQTTVAANAETDATAADTPADTTAAADTAAGETAAPAPGEMKEKQATVQDMTVVYGEDTLSGKFSPFFAETAYDQYIVDFTQIGLLSTDRRGEVVYKGIEGESREYNGTSYSYFGASDLTVTENPDGTVFYDFKLRDDIKFSDGTPVTADDVIFSMYVLADPTYDGSAVFFSMPIEGMTEYRQGMSALWDLLLTAGRDNTDFKYWDEATQTAFWDNVDNTAGPAFAQSIVDYCKAKGYNAADDSVATCAATWGYTLEEGADAKAFWDAIVAAYDTIQDATSTEVADTAFSSLFDPEYLKGVETGEGVDHISGIQKIDDYNIRVVATEANASMVYQLAVPIAPLHYYGNRSEYDYANNKFGFTKGDISSVRAKTSQPLGAGPYVFSKYANGILNLDANQNFFLGAPIIGHLNYIESQEADKLNGITTGTSDVTMPSYGAETRGAICAANSNGQTTGDKITTFTYDTLGYGYIGMNAKLMSIGGVPDSEQSKDFRKAFATIFAVYRDRAVDSYYGDIATVVNYPISNTSWAAPMPTDDGYAVAFSKDVNGGEIYTSGMTDDQRFEAAKQAALGYFEAAGFTVTDGKVTAAPEGASLEYEAMIPGGGAGDHPSFQLLTDASNALKDIGITLRINDLSDPNEMWNGLRAGTVPIWCAAWGATPDPDMYQIYFSGNDSMEAGGSNYMYAISDEDLNELILQARTTTDQTTRKVLYKACLDIIVDWATEVPVYQRQDAVVFSTERVKIDTVTPDITSFYRWYSEMDYMQMVQ